MDLFVLPSRSEGLSVALLEALSAGVPVAVTDVGESREVVCGGRLGTVLPNDPGSWPELLERLVADAGNSGQIARSRVAQQHVHDHYSMQATLDGYEQVYDDVVSKRISNL
jgi:glycosyltransferase involved in cell wall biosynthesis